MIPLRNYLHYFFAALSFTLRNVKSVALLVMVQLAKVDEFR